MTRLLRAGFGASRITPPLPCRLAGFARRNGLSSEVAQHLWARSMVLDDGATRVGWVVCDLLEVGRPLVAEVRAAAEAATDLDGAKVMVSATHTHAGPDLYRDWDGDQGAPDRARAGYLGCLPQAVASSLALAVADLAPASLSWGEDDVYDVGTARRQAGAAATAATAGPQKLSVLSARVEGKPMGMRIVYPCHGTVLGPNNLAVSGDLIGAAIEALERATSAAGRCSWAQGAAGDISTRWSRRERSHAEAQRLGALVAAAARRAAGHAEPLGPGARVHLEHSSLALPRKSLEPQPVPGVVDEALASETAAPGRRHEDDRSPAALAEEAMAALSGRRSGRRAPEDEAELSVLSIGDLRLCFVPGEPFGSLERAVAQQAGARRLRVVGYSNGAPGYIFDPEEEKQGGYEVLASPLTGEASTTIARAVARLAAAP